MGQNSSGKRIHILFILLFTAFTVGADEITARKAGIGGGVTIDISLSGVEGKYLHLEAAWVPLQGDRWMLSVRGLCLLNDEQCLFLFPVQLSFHLVSQGAFSLAPFVGGGCGVEAPSGYFFFMLRAGLSLILPYGFSVEAGSNILLVGENHLDFYPFLSLFYHF